MCDMDQQSFAGSEPFCFALDAARRSPTGWGNAGAGATLLLMPLLYEAFASHVAPAVAWRLAMFVPGALQLLLGVLVLTVTDDLPVGSYPKLR